MSCFSPGMIESLLIDLVWIAVIVGLVRIVLPYILAQLGVGGDIILRAINLIMWGILVIFAIVIVFNLLGCLGGGFLPFRR